MSRIGESYEVHNHDVSNVGQIVVSVDLRAQKGWLCDKEACPDLICSKACICPIIELCRLVSGAHSQSLKIH